MLSYQQIRNERQWKSSTGLSEQQFHRLVKYFGETYEFFQGVSLSTLAARTEVDSTYCLPTRTACFWSCSA